MLRILDWNYLLRGPSWKANDSIKQEKATIDRKCTELVKPNKYFDSIKLIPLY